MRNQKSFVAGDVAVVHSAADLPPVYGLEVFGKDAEPDAIEGEILVFHRDRRPKIGDIVAIWRNPEFVLPGQPQAVLRRLVTALPTYVTSLPWIEHPNSEVRSVVIAALLGRQPRQDAHELCDVLAIHPAEATIEQAKRAAGKEMEVA